MSSGELRTGLPSSDYKDLVDLYRLKAAYIHEGSVDNARKLVDVNMAISALSTSVALELDISQAEVEGLALAEAGGA